MDSNLETDLRLIVDLPSQMKEAIAAKKKEKEQIEGKFREVWSVLLNDVRSDPQFADIQGLVDRLVDVLEKNVPFGKQARAYLSIFVYRSMKPDRTEEDDFLTYVAAWMIEVAQAVALMADDIMDNSETRRGMPCWYKNPNVGQAFALNDTVLMEYFTGHIMMKYFTGQDYYLQMLESSVNTGWYTVLGESLDLKMAADGRPNLDKFTEAIYKSLVKYKTSYYTFYSPVVTSLIRAGVHDKATLRIVEEITLMMGELFQIQDDFLDCFGDVEITGKVGTDIKDGKLTWLIAKALQLASKSHMESLREFYGQPSAVAEYKVKSVYDDLGIKKVFLRHERLEGQKILRRIKTLPRGIPQQPFLDALNAMYRRKK